jgi:ubiquinone biosynthesis protein
MFKYRIRLPTNFTLLIRCLIILEGIGRQLESNFNPTANMTPYAQGLIKKQYSPVKIVNDFGQFFKENLWIMKSFPNDLLLFVQKVIKGKAEIRLDHQGLDDLNHTLNKASSRLTSGIIIAGMIMASAFIIRSNLPPLIAGFSFLGIAGYLISGLLAVIILREVIKDIK